MSREVPDDDVAHHLLIRTLLICIAFSAFRIICVYCSPVSYEMQEDPILAGAGGLLLVLGLVYMTVRPDRWLRDICLAIGIPLVCQICACEFGNLPFYFGRSYPLQDGTLASIDEAVGFCWPCAVHWFDRHQTINLVCTLFYHSIYMQPVVLAGILIRQRDISRLCVYFIAYNVAYAITNVVAYRFPALGVYEFFHLTASDHPNIEMRFTNQMTVPIQMLREGYLSRAFTDQQILISFPSFHAVLACLFTWCAWRSGFRWFFIPTNTVMLIATPIQGGHYLIDVVVGLAVAAVSITASSALVSSMTFHHRIGLDDGRARGLVPSRSGIGSR